MAKKTGTRACISARARLRADGTLFITTGDRGDGERAQDMHDTAGAVLRIKPDGSIPADNPSPDGSKMAAAKSGPRVTATSRARPSTR